MQPIASIALLVLCAGTAAAQDSATQQMRDAQGTRIELHQDFRSDQSGASSGVATRIQRADGTGEIIGREQAVAAPMPLIPPIPPAVTTTTTTHESRIGR